MSADRERDAAIARLEATFAQLFASARAHLATVADAVSPGMVPVTYKVLSTIAHEGPLTVSALATHLVIDKAQASRAIGELEGLGFIERTSDEKDRRIRIVAATPLAKERLDAARGGRGNLFTERVAEWETTSIDELQRLLAAFAAGEVPNRP